MSKSGVYIRPLYDFVVIDRKTGAREIVKNAMFSYTAADGITEIWFDNNTCITYEPGTVDVYKV